MQNPKITGARFCQYLSTAIRQEAVNLGPKNILKLTRVHLIYGLHTKLMP